MAQTQSVTGRFGNATVIGVAVGITEWHGTLIKDFAKSTDSNDYDTTTQQTYQSRKPGVIRLEGSLVGNFDLGGTTDSQFIQKFKTDGPYAMTLGITRSINYCSGNFDFDNIKVDLVVGDANMVTFSADFQSNGVITLP